MNTRLKTLSVLCAGALLIACADIGQRLPFAASAPAALSANESYVLARSAHLAGRQRQALAGYAAALQADPQHVNARNGLATLYAEQGDFERAIPIWEALTAAARGPASAYLFSNLGYARYLQGDFEQARAALQQACLLDPLSYRAWQHLGSTLDKLGLHDRARQMQRQAQVLQQHDLRADYAVAPRAGLPAIEQAIEAAPEQWAATEIRQQANGMFELRRVGPAPAQAAAAAVAPGAPVPLAQLEIRNGNGVRGMARALSRKLDGTELRVVRLSNERGFGVKQTRVEYRRPYRAAAQQLAGRFASATVQEAVAPQAADMRLVIGRDLARGGLAMRPVPFVPHQTGPLPARDNGADTNATTGATP